MRMLWSLTATTSRTPLSCPFLPTPHALNRPVAHVSIDACSVVGTTATAISSEDAFSSVSSTTVMRLHRSAPSTPVVSTHRPFGAGYGTSAAAGAAIPRIAAPATPMTTMNRFPMTGW